MDFSVAWATFFFLFGCFNTFLLFKLLNLAYRVHKLEDILNNLTQTLDILGISATASAYQEQQNMSAETSDNREYIG